MNDLDLIRELRPEVPLARAAELATARERLMAAVTAGNQDPSGTPMAGKRLRPSWRVALAAATAAAAVGIAAAVLVSSAVPSRGPSTALNHPRPGRSSVATAHPHRIAVPATLTAAQFLNSAAAAVAHRAAVPPLPGQYVYSENVTPGSGWSKEWLSADGAEPGLIEDSTTPAYATSEPPCTVAQAEATSCYIAAGYLPGLPVHADAVLAYLAKLDLAAATPPYSDEPANWMANDLGKAVGELMSTTYLLPAQQSAIFRLLAQTPGFQIVRSADDPAGRPGVGIFWSYQGGGAMITFDPATYAFLGFGTWPAGSQPVLTGQNVTTPDGSALTAMAIVNALPPHHGIPQALTALMLQVKQWAVKTHQPGTPIQVVTAYLREVLHLSPAKVHMMLSKLGIGPA